MDICPCNICPGNICPYQQYLSCYRPDFDLTSKSAFLDHLQQMSTVMVKFVQATFNLATFVIISNISAVTEPILNQTFSTQIFLDLIFSEPKFFKARIVLCQKNFGSNFFEPNIFSTKHFLDLRFVWIQIKTFFDKKSISTKFFCQIFFDDFLRDFFDEFFDEFSCRIFF